MKQFFMIFGLAPSFPSFPRAVSPWAWNLVFGPTWAPIKDSNHSMESRLGHAHKMMFPLKCIGKKQHQKLPEND